MRKKADHNQLTKLANLRKINIPNEIGLDASRMGAEGEKSFLS
jgi:hypothetical protein